MPLQGIHQTHLPSCSTSSLHTLPLLETQILGTRPHAGVGQGKLIPTSVAWHLGKYETFHFSYGETEAERNWTLPKTPNECALEPDKNESWPHRIPQRA